MHALIVRAEAGGEISTEELRALKLLDEAVLAQRPADDLLRIAETICGRQVAVIDLLNNAHLISGNSLAHGSEFDEENGRRVISTLSYSESAGHLDDSCFVRLEDSSGLLGAVWLEPLEEIWDQAVIPVMERLAFGLVLTMRRTAAEARRVQTFDDDALGLLVQPNLDSETVMDLCRRTGLRAANDYRCLAAISVAPHPASPSVIARKIMTLLGVSASQSRFTDVGGVALIVIDGHVPAQRWSQVDLWRRLSEEFGVRIGIGPARHTVALGESWKQAKDALRLGLDDASTGPAVSADDLGAWILLGRISPTELAEVADVQQLLRLEAECTRTPNQLIILKAYCEAGTLREASRALHMHHSTLEYKVRRLAEQLGCDLSKPLVRLRYLLSIRLILAARVRLDSQYGG
jgi:hypothetical protein